jgi:hypothetical protein
MGIFGFYSRPKILLQILVNPQNDLGGERTRRLVVARNEAISTLANRLTAISGLPGSHAPSPYALRFVDGLMQRLLRSSQ